MECKTFDSTANLATILDEPTNSFVQSIIDGWSWIGLEKVNGEWVWPDGTKAIYTNWGPETPSGDRPFTDIDKISGKWFDVPNSYSNGLPTVTLGAVCQYDPYARGRYTVL